MPSTRMTLAAALAMLGIAGLWLMVAPGEQAASVERDERVLDRAPPLPFSSATPRAPADAGVAVERLAPTAAATSLPPASDPPIDRVLARVKYGDAHDTLGIQVPAHGFDGMPYPPQGFAPLADGRLIVLDTAKLRLVWFGTDGRFERALALPPELRLPADVVVAQDGTIVVVDHEGVETAGSVMFDPEGNVKARLPQMGNGEMVDVYAVGNDIYFGYGGIHKSIKAGDTSGSASDETPSVYDQAGIIPGRVAPDGRTVLHASYTKADRHELLVSVITGDRPDHVFSRVYRDDEEIRSLSHVEADGSGIIYVVVDRRRGERALLCFDGKTGDPIGKVRIPRDASDGMPFSQFVVLESGGLVMQQMEVDGCTYRFIDCRPGA